MHRIKDGTKHDFKVAHISFVELCHLIRVLGIRSLQSIACWQANAHNVMPCEASHVNELELHVNLIE